jgi:hypothetical protein
VRLLTKKQTFRRYFGIVDEHEGIVISRVKSVQGRGTNKGYTHNKLETWEGSETYVGKFFICPYDYCHDAWCIIVRTMTIQGT